MIAVRAPRAEHTIRMMRLAFIAAECEPWAKAGGLADVVDALARALGRIPDGSGELVDVFLPRYRGVPVPEEPHDPGAVVVPDPRAIGSRAMVGVQETETHGYRLQLIDHPPAFDRADIYGYEDDAWRFGLFCRAALEVLRADEVAPDVIHIHDWHGCPAILYRDLFYPDDAGLRGVATMLT